MKTKDILDLIQIRSYMMMSMENHATPKVSLNEIDRIRTFLDKKIVGALTSTEFKQAIGYEVVEKVETVKSAVVSRNPRT